MSFSDASAADRADRTTGVPGAPPAPDASPVGGSPEGSLPVAPAVAPSRSVEVTRSEERLVPGVERHAVGVVRYGKRVVTEERTVTVTVRREELFVENLPAGEATGHGPAGPRAEGLVATLTLSEEVPEVTLRTVPRETVRLFVDRIASDAPVTAEVAHEVVEHDVVPVDDVPAATDRV